MKHEYGAVVARCLQGNRSSRRKISRSAILSTTDVGSNACLHGKGPATNRLSGYILIFICKYVYNAIHIHKHTCDNNNNNNNGYSALGPVWQEPEPSQATGMALIHSILGKFLGVACHCFPHIRYGY
jgi:hypothetical protein